MHSRFYANKIFCFVHIYSCSIRIVLHFVLKMQTFGPFYSLLSCNVSHFLILIFFFCIRLFRERNSLSLSVCRCLCNLPPSSSVSASDTFSFSSIEMTPANESGWVLLHAHFILLFFSFPSCHIKLDATSQWTARYSKISSSVFMLLHNSFTFYPWKRIKRFVLLHLILPRSLPHEKSVNSPANQ